MALPIFEAIKVLAKQAGTKYNKTVKIRIPSYIWVSVLISVFVSSIVGFAMGGLAFGLLQKTSPEYLPEFLQSLVEKENKAGDIEFITPGKEIIREKVIVEKEYVPQTSQEELIIRTVKEASNSVVSIIISKDVPVFEQYTADPFQEFEQFFGDDFFSPFQFQVPQYRQKGTEKRQVGGGTGFIITGDGLVLTNKHVVQDSSAEYTVFTNKGEKYPAQVLARDPFKDLAVIKVNAKNLAPVKLGDSDALKIGQTVISIGNALAKFQNTVSVGVVSGLDRTLVADGQRIEGVIQTDAAINRGNSGGPLLNLKGEVVGINTAMVIGAQNIGFALSVNDAKKVITEVETIGKIVYPFLGVRYVMITPDIKEKQKLPVDYGAWVIRGDVREDVAVVPGSAADKAGIQENDIILEADNAKLTKDAPLSKVILGHMVGDAINLKILRQGKEILIQTILQEIQ